jgi:exodeoxyribonuclease VII small subunit
MPTKPAVPASHTFETAMERLEKVVEEMGSDKLPLEDLITRYEEGIQLVKVCEDRLQAVEKRVEIITRTASGDPALVPFEPEKKPVTGPREDVSLF